MSPISGSVAVPDFATFEAMVPAPLLYSKLAEWWPLMSAPADYAEEAAGYERLLLAAGDQPAVTLLELGSGGGNNASYLRKRFRMTLTDVSPGMLEVSRSLNPDCEHLEGDMRTLRLNRQFDRVFVHDAIAYMTSESDLRRAIMTAAVHCRRGGGVVLAPDHLRENFRPSTDHGGHDGNDGRAMRYLAWSQDPEPADDTCISDYVYLLRERDGTVTVEHDRHLEGVFPRQLWLDLMTETGLDPQAVPFEHSELEPGSYELFVGRKT